MEPEREEVEQIPWTMLADQLEGGRRKSLGALVLAVLVAVVVAVVAINLLRRPAGTTIEATPVAADEAAPVDPVESATGSPSLETEPTPVAPPTTAGSEAIGPPSSPGLYSEADLMAMVPDAGPDHLVATVAEWFVADYFTVLGPGDDAIRTVEGLPQPEVLEGGYSWVEWVSRAGIEPLAADRFDVTVLFRTVNRADDGVLVRTAVRSAVVEIVVDASGAPSVVGLPRIVAAPRLSATAGGSIVTPPPEAADEALARAGDIGAEPRLEGAIDAGAAWRVVVSVVDGAGIRWPLMIDVAKPGSDPES